MRCLKSSVELYLFPTRSVSFAKIGSDMPDFAVIFHFIVRAHCTSSLNKVTFLSIGKESTLCKNCQQRKTVGCQWRGVCDHFHSKEEEEENIQALKEANMQLLHVIHSTILNETSAYRGSQPEAGMNNRHRLSYLCPACECPVEVQPMLLPLGPHQVYVLHTGCILLNTEVGGGGWPTVICVCPTTVQSPLPLQFGVERGLDVLHTQMNMLRGSLWVSLDFWVSALIWSQKGMRCPRHAQGKRRGTAVFIHGAICWHTLTPSCTGRGSDVSGWSSWIWGLIQQHLKFIYVCK